MLSVVADLVPAAVADRLIISKTDIASAEQIAALEARLSTLNPGAPIMRVVAGDVAPDASVILHEPLTWGLLVGFPLVLIGSYLATRRSLTVVDPDVATDIDILQKESKQDRADVELTYDFYRDLKVLDRDGAIQNKGLADLVALLKEQGDLEGSTELTRFYDVALGAKAR